MIVLKGIPIEPRVWHADEPYVSYIQSHIQVEHDNSPDDSKRHEHRDCHPRSSMPPHVSASQLCLNKTHSRLTLVGGKITRKERVKTRTQRFSLYSFLTRLRNFPAGSKTRTHSIVRLRPVDEIQSNQQPLMGSGDLCTTDERSARAAGLLGIR